MEVIWGLDAAAKKRGSHVPVKWDSKKAVNPHILVEGMSGAGKSYTLRSAIRQMCETADPKSPVKLRIHVFDPHGDMEIEGASSVMFSEQSKCGMNPLRVNSDPHFGGLRKRVQGFIATMNRVMRQLGGKQEAALRNILYDLYASHGFRQDDPSTWLIDDSSAHLISDGSDNRLYLDVPRPEKDQAKALGAKWDPDKFCWWVAPDQYQGGITRWQPKTAGRTHPSITDALNYARRILRMSFMGSDQEAITNLDIHNRAVSSYQKKVLEAMRRGDQVIDKDKQEADLEKSGAKAIESFSNYVAKIRSGIEIEAVMKYDSVDVLKSVVDRLENLEAIGVFRPTPPPFDPNATVWHYNLRALSMEERKLFVLFRLEEMFMNAVQRGEQDDVVEVAVLDEAHIYMDDDPENILNTISKEARKFGLALVAASQSPMHFPDDFVTTVATKIILGLDESFWVPAARKMRVPEAALKWIRPTQSLLAQLKEKGSSKTEWSWVVTGKAQDAELPAIPMEEQ